MGKFLFSGVDVEGLFILPQAVDIMELLQPSCPLCCFIETIDLGEMGLPANRGHVVELPSG